MSIEADQATLLRESSEKRAIRDVVVLEPRWTIELFQSFYLDRSRRRIKPNVVVLEPPAMTVYFEINSFGFKGQEIDPSKRLVAVWGDSVIFGVGRGWVEELGSFFEGFQFLNGGLEGDDLKNIGKRAAESNGKLRIDFNIIFPGWHSMKSARKLRSLLTDMLDQLRGPILCTVPTALSERLAGEDLSGYFTTPKSNKRPLSLFNGPRQDESKFWQTTDLEEGFFFWGNLKYSTKNAKKLLHQLQEQNSIVRELAQKRGVPLIEFHDSFYSDDASRFREVFFDAGHPRPSAYPRILKCWSEALKPVLV